MKKIFYILSLFLAIQSCSDDEMYYDLEKNYIHFEFASIEDRSYTFSNQAPNVLCDTALITLNSTGDPKNYDRYYDIIVDEENSSVNSDEYEILSNDFVLKADSLNSYFYVVFNKSPRMKDSTLNILLKIVESEYFYRPMRENNEIELSINNIVEKPDWWTNYATLFGVYSMEKYQLWMKYFPKGRHPMYDYENMPWFFNMMLTKLFSPEIFVYIDQMKKDCFEKEYYDGEGNRILLP